MPAPAEFSSKFGGASASFNSAVSKHDERSIGTFEIDQNKIPGIEQGDQCQGLDWAGKHEV